MFAGLHNESRTHNELLVSEIIVSEIIGKKRLGAQLRFRDKACGKLA